MVKTGYGFLLALAVCLGVVAVVKADFEVRFLAMTLSSDGVI